MTSPTEPKFIAGNSNPDLARSIAKRVSFHRGQRVDLVDTRVERFNDGEIFVEVYENVRGEDMFIIQSTSNPANDNLICAAALPVLTESPAEASFSMVTACWSSMTRNELPAATPGLH